MKWRPDTTTILLLVVLLVSGSMWWSLRNLQTGIRQVIEQQERFMDSITETITTDSGRVLTVTCVRAASETDAAFKARQKAWMDDLRDDS